jgi:hypothetical protein
MSEQGGRLLPYTSLHALTRIHVERVLPVPGEILVRIGDWVDASQVIGRVPVHGEVRVVNVAQVLGLIDIDLSQVMVKKRGDWVESGEVLAARRAILPFWHKPCRSPVTGRLAAMGYGWVVIETEQVAQTPGSSRGCPSAAEWRPEARLCNLSALVPGHVVDVASNRSVILETVGAHIVGACGLGGEVGGVLRVAVDGPGDMLASDDVGMGFNNAVLLGGAGLTPEVVERAGEMQVKGMIVGSMSASLLESLKEPPFPIVATEGYGNLPMSSIAFDILKRQEGREVYLNGRGGHTRQLRPTIVVPLTEYARSENEALVSPSPMEPLRTGDLVRAVRRPLMGQLGEVVSFPTEPQTLPSGFSLTGAQVVFADLATTESGRDNALRTEEGHALSSVAAVRPVSSSRFVPWANLERVGS